MASSVATQMTSKPRSVGPGGVFTEGGPTLGAGIGAVQAGFPVSGPDYGIVIVAGSSSRGPHREALDDVVLRSLDAVPADGRAHTVSLAGLGDYRVLVQAFPKGQLVVGLPTSGIDDVVSQLKRFDHTVGGLGNFLMMAHAGTLTHAEVEDQLRLVAREVLPRMQEREGAVAAG